MQTPRPFPPGCRIALRPRSALQRTPGAGPVSQSQSRFCYQDFRVNRDNLQTWVGREQGGLGMRFREELITGILWDWNWEEVGLKKSRFMSRLASDPCPLCWSANLACTPLSITKAWEPGKKAPAD